MFFCPASPTSASIWQDQIKELEDLAFRLIKPGHLRQRAFWNEKRASDNRLAPEPRIKLRAKGMSQGRLAHHQHCQEDAWQRQGFEQVFDLASRSRPLHGA